MHCPLCQQLMEKGRLEVHGTVRGAMIFGFSQEDLYWYDEGRSRDSRRRVLDSGDARVAYGCKPCGTIAFDTTKRSGNEYWAARRTTKLKQLFRRNR